MKGLPPPSPLVSTSVQQARPGKEAHSLQFAHVFFFSFFFIFKCALKSLDPPFLCCLWKEAGWYLRDSFITLESVFTICSAVSGVSLSLQARRNSCCVLNWQSGRDPCSLEGKQEWIVPSHCAVPSLLSLCKLTRCVVYSSSIECFKQILFFFFSSFFSNMSWLHKIQDGWMVAELLDPAAWHCWLTDFSVQAVPFSWERTETANSTAPSFANKWSLIVTEAAMAAGRGRGWCWHEAGLEDGRMPIFLSRPWGCWGCMALTLVTFLCFWWGPANPICQSQCSILAAYFVFNQ